MISKSVLEEYSTTLNQQKRIIETNTYARELEGKYHKSNRRRFLQINITPTIDEPSFWPIESPVFTEVLRSKLKNVSCKVSPSSALNKKVLADLQKNYHSRFQSDNINLPKLDKNRFWSPFKANSRLNYYKDLNNGKGRKEFGPKVKSIHLQQKFFALI